MCLTASSRLSTIGHGEVQVHVFGGPVLVRGGDRVDRGRQRGADPVVGVQGDAGGAQCRGDGGQHGGRRSGPAGSPRCCRRWAAGSWRSAGSPRPCPRSAEASRKMCTLPSPVSITGTLALVTTDWISSRPPRGIRTSTRPRARIRALAPSRPYWSTVCTASAGRPTESRASRSTVTRAALVARQRRSRRAG